MDLYLQSYTHAIMQLNYTTQLHLFRDTFLYNLISLRWMYADYVVKCTTDNANLIASRQGAHWDRFWQHEHYCEFSRSPCGFKYMYLHEAHANIRHRVCIFISKNTLRINSPETALLLSIIIMFVVLMVRFFQKWHFRYI